MDWTKTGWTKMNWTKSRSTVEEVVRRVSRSIFGVSEKVVSCLCCLAKQLKILREWDYTRVAGGR